MYAKSIGLRSEFLLLENISKVEKRDGYTIVKTPQNPRYISANFILFEKPPRSEDCKIWPEIFKKEFEDSPMVKHMKLSWPSVDERTGEIELFLKEGFELEFYQALVADSVKIPEKVDLNFEVREVYLDEMSEVWDQVCQDQMVFRPEGLSVEYYEKFAEALMLDYKSLIKKGLCRWFGGFLHGQLVGSVGILWDDDMVAFQRVIVRPRYQGHRFCKAMLYEVGERVRSKVKKRKLLALAEQGSRATKLYESLGFNIVEDLLSLYRYDFRDRSL